MTTHVLRGAHSDVADGQRWYNTKERGLGGRFRRAVHAAVTRIVNAPATPPLWPKVDPSLGVRRYLVERWPYSIANMVHRQQLVIVAVVHHRRPPGYWLDRIH